MSEKEPRGGDQVEFLKVTEGKQTVAEGERGEYLGGMPGIDGLHGIKLEKEITVGKQTGKVILVKRNEFKILEGEEGK